MFHIKKIGFWGFVDFVSDMHNTNFCANEYGRWQIVTYNIFYRFGVDPIPLPYKTAVYRQRLQEAKKDDRMEKFPLYVPSIIGENEHQNIRNAKLNKQLVRPYTNTDYRLHMYHLRTAFSNAVRGVQSTGKPFEKIYIIHSLAETPSIFGANSDIDILIMGGDGWTEEELTERKYKKPIEILFEDVFSQYYNRQFLNTGMARGISKPAITVTSMPENSMELKYLTIYDETPISSIFDLSRETDAKAFFKSKSPRKIEGVA